MESKKKIIIQAIICVGLLCVIWGGYFYLQELQVHQMNLGEDDFSWVYQVDDMEVRDGELVLQGFAFQVNCEAKSKSFSISLRDTVSGEMFFPEMKYLEREDVSNYFSCQFSYLKSGFEARIRTKQLNLKKTVYEIVLRPVRGDNAYQTGLYIVDEKLMYTNPLNYKMLEVEGTDLQKIVEEGFLRVYRPDYGMYVYQYENELYWIAEQEYAFDKNADTYVQYQLETTQSAKLPKERVENKWYWDNIGFMFTENELEDWKTGEYRVTKKALPTEYSIKKIWTGNHENGWIWRQDFRPYYDFGE